MQISRIHDAPRKRRHQFPAGAVAGWDLHPLESAAFSVCALLAAVGVLNITGSGIGDLIRSMANMALAATLEELLFRAVLFRIMASWLGPWVAWGVSSLLFALAHVLNNGFSLLAFVSLVVAGLMLAAAYMVHDRVWLPIGLHFGWNYTTDGVFGLSSSGQAAHGYWPPCASNRMCCIFVLIRRGSVDSRITHIVAVSQMRRAGQKSALMSAYSTKPRGAKSDGRCNQLPLA